MVKIAICDDSHIELNNMLNLIDEYKSIKSASCTVKSFSSGFELISALENGEQFNLYFLDIIMPTVSGIDTAREIRMHDKNACIVFASSSPEFALDGYSVRAMNYIIKPISRKALFPLLDEIFELLDVQQEQYVVIKGIDGINRIFLSNLIYVEVQNRNIHYHLSSGRIIKSSELFSTVCENLLQHSNFIKPHRSYIVNMMYIDNITLKDIILNNGVQIPIARGNSRDVKLEYWTYQTS